MTDRIAELRALIAADDAAWRESRNHPSRETLRAYVESGEVLDEAVMNALPALLDCAEALTEILRCPHGVDEATIPAGGIDVHPKQVVVSMSVGLVRLRRAQAALAKLNGDNHD